MPKADETHTAPLSSRAMPTPFYVKYGARLAKAEAAAAVLLNEVRAAAAYLREQHGYSLSGFVICTGLHKNSLLKLADPTWVPEPETLWDLDQLIIRAAAKRRGEIFEGETIKRGRPGRK
jgi:hypothetical protein